MPTVHTNEYKTLAEIYRNREHALLTYIIRYLDDDALELKDLKKFITQHLGSTGRSLESPLLTPELTPVDDPVRKALLEFLRPTEKELAPRRRRKRRDTQ